MSPHRPNSQQNGDSSAKKRPPQHDFYFLNPEAADALPVFRYAGEDRSLLYHYVLSPLAAYLVHKWTPRTVAPNTITLTGLCLMVVSYIAMYCYVPGMQVNPASPPPSWLFFLNTSAMLIYQTLDNMDGKQSRATGSSSPLGLLFDHGCDAVNSVFGSANWIIAMGMHPVDDFWAFWILVIGPMLMFYVATWEEYYTGKLVLPIVNGPSEGLFLGAMLSMTSGLFGISFWQQTNWFDSVVQPHILPLLPDRIESLVPLEGLRNADIIVIASTLGFFQEVVLKSINVCSRYGVKSLLGFSPFVTMSILWFVIGSYDENVWSRIPRTGMHLCSCLFVEMCTQLMLDHITAQRFKPFRWTLTPLALLAGLVVSGQWKAGTTTDDYLMVYTTALTTYTFMKMSVVIHEACTILNIWCFDIVTPRKAAAVPVNQNGSSYETAMSSPNEKRTTGTLRKRGKS